MGAVSLKQATKARILVVDDHPLMREGLASLIKRHEDFIFCGGAGSVAETHEAVKTAKPDLVLLDLFLNGGDGLELIKVLKSQFPSLLILVLSQFDESLYAERVLRAGAHGYVMKERAVKEVVDAIRMILAGELYVSSKVAALALQKMIRTKPDTKNGSNGDGCVENLSDRELQVFQLLGIGMGTRKIADKLNLSLKTIETHRENIKRKLGLRGATELVNHATHWVGNQSVPHFRIELLDRKNGEHD